MPVPILMPALSPTMTEGNIAKWLIKEGDTIKPGDVIAEVETDKATMEVESIDEGSLAKIISKDGEENVKVNSIIGVIALPEDKENDISDFVAKYLEEDFKTKNDKNKIINIKRENITEKENTKKAEEKNEHNDNQTGASIVEPQNISDNQSINKDDKGTFIYNDNRVFASPLAKRIANLKNLDLSIIKGSGPKGRIIKKDLDFYLVENALENNDEKMSFEKIPLTNIRKTIAKRLQESKKNIPHYYLKCKICVDPILLARKTINDFLSNSEDNHLKISLNDFFIKATALSISKVPMLNTIWDNDALISYKKVDISVAVATESGLFTPVIRSACQKNISQISQEMKNYVKKAYENKLLPQDYSGGSFSFSNLGMYDIDEFSAIINPPQAGILAIGGINKELYMKDNIPIEKNMMTFTLSVDHRIADGAQASKFFYFFKHFINNPVGMVI